MSGPHKPKKEVEYLKRISRFPDAIIRAPENAPMEGFEYFETKEYLSKPNAISRRKNMLRMLTQFGLGEFAKTTRAMGGNVTGLLANQRKNYTDVEPYVHELVETGTMPSSNVELIKHRPNADLWERLKEYAWATHRVVVGFTEVTPGMIFKGKAVPFEYAVVCIQEMKKQAFDKKPIVNAGREVVRVYNSLGQATNDIAGWLRVQGIVCQANHPFGGLVDYAPLAEKAGLGRMGHNGLLITPKWGMRERISPIYVNGPIFDITDNTDHNWIDDFCMSCRNCERGCPTGAIYDEPRIVSMNAFGERPRAETIDREKCFAYFSQTLGCSQCIRDCPFSSGQYDKIKTGWNAALEARSNATVYPVEESAVSGAVGSEPTRIAVVGAGAAGLFATEEILRKTIQTRIDVIETLPVPYGLVRYGVAPDHPEVKSKEYYFHDILRDPRVSFIGNVRLGEGVEVEELQSAYDSVVIATGASAGRDLDIPGEELYGSVAAPDFVGWYNSHPACKGLELPGKSGQVAIIGLGNVALDCARILLKNSDELRRTDISHAALARISKMDVRTVHIIGRRGPSASNFTPRELRDLVELPGVEAVVDRDDIERDQFHSPAGIGVELSGDPQADRRVINFHMFKEIADGGFREPGRRLRKVHFHFFSSPTRICGSRSVRALELERTALTTENEKTVITGTGEKRQIPCRLILRSVGYRSEAIRGVPVQDRNGIIANDQGRVLDANGNAVPGLYCSGWVRRGPNGIVGTNKADAIEVVEKLLEDCQVRVDKRHTADGILPILTERRHLTVARTGFELIVGTERLRGSEIHKHAIKFDSVTDMIRIVEER